MSIIDRRSPMQSAVVHNVPAVADAREPERAGVPKGEPPRAAKRHPPCYQQSLPPGWCRASKNRRMPGVSDVFKSQ